VKVFDPLHDGTPSAFLALVARANRGLGLQVLECHCCRRVVRLWLTDGRGAVFPAGDSYPPWGAAALRRALPLTLLDGRPGAAR